MKTDTDTKKTGLVVKGNELIEASYRLSLMEQRLILFAIVEARETQQGLGDGFVTIEALKFARMFDLAENSIYDDLKVALLSLYRREISFRDIHPESGKVRVVLTRWILAGSYITDGGAVQIMFSPGVVPYITRLEQEFTAYRLERIGKLSSAHAVRMYELLLQHLSIGRRDVDLAWLKETLCVEDQYQRLVDLKRRVIDPSVAQINQHTDLQVDYQNIKSGRTVTGLRFAIQKKLPPKPPRHPRITDSYIAARARPGETRDQVVARIREERRLATGARA